jgi:hypothetical protein
MVSVQKHITFLLSSRADWPGLSINIKRPKYSVTAQIVSRKPQLQPAAGNINNYQQKDTRTKILKTTQF